MFVVGESKWAECCVEVYDRYIGSAGQARHERHVDVDAGAVGWWRWKQQAGEWDLREDWSFASRVEEESEVAFLFGGAQDRDFGALVKGFWSDRDLGGGATFAHVRVGGTAFGAEGFESFLGAGCQAQFADCDAKAAGVAHVQFG